MTSNKPNIETPLPHPLLAILPVLVLVILVALAVFFFGADALTGSSQLALLLATAFCLLVAKLSSGMHWATFEKAIHKNFKNISTALLILLVIGGLSGTWMLSGIVPMFISWGIDLIHPDIFLVSAALICAIVSVLTGSSWTTVATIGVALLGVGRALGFDDGWIAGAIVSGAYFGDKLSPLSDTTILASSVTGTPLFTHIRYMLITTIPSFLIAIIVFALAGFLIPNTADSETLIYKQLLNEKFHLTPWLLLVPLITAFMIYKRYPALIVLFVSMLAAAIMAVIFQPQILAELANVSHPDASDKIKSTMLMCFGGTAITTGNAEIDSLLATKGMQGMLYTIWLIICAVCFGAAMSAGRMIDSITAFMTRKIEKTTSLVGATVGTGLLVNLSMGDQYLALILTGNVFKDLYAAKTYESRLLSRSMEDSITVTSVLIPWNSCGMTQSTVLGVSTLTYLPYAVFNYVSPIMSIVVASLAYKIVAPKPQNEILEPGQ